MIGFKNSAVVFVALVVSLLVACEPEEQPASWDGATILISVDGFRWDYRSFADTPGLDRLAEHGVAAGLRPSFPPITFTTHHTIATGLHPNQHGVVGNTMYDPDLDERFSMGNDETVGDGRWWGGEPIWVTAEKAGLIAATYFWPGTEAEIDGVRPTYWKKYDGNVPGTDRVDQVLEWLALPTTLRPSLMTLYFSEVDSAGHRFGPESPETARAIQQVDSYIARLLVGIDSQGFSEQINIVVTSDHGMSQLSPDRVIFVDDYIDMDKAGWLSLGQYVALRPDPDDVEEVYAGLLGGHQALTVYRKGEIPEHLHIDGHRRTPLIVGIVENGWSASTHSWVERSENPFRGGGHGFDNQEKSMEGVFIASGPAFRSGVAFETVDAVDVYNLLASSLGLVPAENEGNVSIMAGILEPAGH